MKRLLVIVPAYNEEENISSTVTGIRSVDLKDCDLDILVVNDCSKDKTLQAIRTLGVKYLNLPVNLGIGGAMQSGYKYAARNDYDIAVQMDGDGQHDPAFLQKLIAPIISGDADLTVGSRFIDKQGFQSTWQRRLGIIFLSGLIRMCTGKRITDVTSGFRAANKKVVSLFVDEYAVDYPEPESLVSSLMRGVKVLEVPVIMKERQGGVSSISAAKSIYYMLKVSMAILIKRVSGKRG